jgi:hypothetical protein
MSPRGLLFQDCQDKPPLDCLRVTIFCLSTVSTLFRFSERKLLSRLFSLSSFLFVHKARRNIPV